MDSGYKTIPLAKFSRMQRIEEDTQFTEVNASLADWSGYLKSWSGFQNYKKANGEELAERLMDEFEHKCANALSRKVEDRNTIELCLRTHYWLILYEK